MTMDRFLYLASSADSDHSPRVLETLQHSPVVPECDHTQAFDLERFIWKHLAGTIAARRDWEGSVRWTLSPCPFNPVHTDGSAYIVRLTSGDIRASCHHEACNWNWHDLFRRFEGTASWDVPVSVADVAPSMLPTLQSVRQEEPEATDVLADLVTEKFAALRDGTMSETQRALLFRIASAIQQITTTIVPPDQAVSLTLPSVRYSNLCEQYDLQRAFERIPAWVLEALQVAPEPGLRADRGMPAQS